MPGRYSNMRRQTGNEAAAGAGARLALFGFSLLFALGAAGGCGPAEPDVLGQFRDQEPLSLADIAEGPTQRNQLITLKGTVARVCAVSGCWLDLKDGRHSVRVELLGFTVARSREGQDCSVQGTIVEKEGRPIVLARGVSFDR